MNKRRLGLFNGWRVGDLEVVTIADWDDLSPPEDDLVAPSRARPHFEQDSWVDKMEDKS